MGRIYDSNKVFNTMPDLQNVNYNIGINAPLDTRLVVDTKTSLTDSATWNKVGIYSGMLVVTEDTGEIYILVGNDYSSVVGETVTGYSVKSGISKTYSYTGRSQTFVLGYLDGIVTDNHTTNEDDEYDGTLTLSSNITTSQYKHVYGNVGDWNDDELEILNFFKASSTNISDIYEASSYATTGWKHIGDISASSISGLDEKINQAISDKVGSDVLTKTILFGSSTGTTIASSYLPSYVDDIVVVEAVKGSGNTYTLTYQDDSDNYTTGATVLESDSGTTGRIYVDSDGNQYRITSGTTAIMINSSTDASRITTLENQLTWKSVSKVYGLADVSSIIATPLGINASDITEGDSLEDLGAVEDDGDVDNVKAALKAAYPSADFSEITIASTVSDIIKCLNA